MMRYDKERKSLLIRIDDNCPEELIGCYHDAVIDLLDKIDEDLIGNDSLGPLLKLVKAMSPSFLQWCAITERKAKAGTEPTAVFFDGGFYLNVASEDPCIGSKMVRALLFYATASARPLSGTTLYYALNLVEKLLPSDTQLNEIYSK